MTALKIERVEPIGSERRPVFVNPGGLRMLDMPIYPADAIAAGSELRDMRMFRGLSLRGMAAVLGLSVVEYGELERGRARCDRAELLAMLERSARP